MGPGFESPKAHQIAAGRPEVIKWPVGQVVKTAASHAANGSSTLPRVTKLNKRGRAGRWKGKKKEFFVAFFLPTKKAVGIDCDEGPPVPIPNTEVKLICAEDTLRVTARENR